jgi:ribonuclease Z
VVLRITFLGTSGTIPTVNRNPSAILINFKGERILFDCGEGTQRQMMKAKTGFRKLNRIFITHFHTDHYLGLFGLLETMSLQDRSEAIHIFGPEGISELIHVFRRLGYTNMGYPIHVHELKEGDTVEGDGYKVICCRAEHNIPCNAYAFIENDRPGKFNRKKAEKLGIPPGPLFKKLQMGEPVEINGKIIHPEEVVGNRRRGRKVVYSGDTRPSQKIVELAKDADLLIHEACFTEDLKEWAVETYHSTAKEAGEIARRSKVKRLILTHISPRYDNGEALIIEAEKEFSNVDIASDFMTIEIQYPD